MFSMTSPRPSSLSERTGWRRTKRQVEGEVSWEGRSVLQPIPFSRLFGLYLQPLERSGSVEITCSHAKLRCLPFDRRSYPRDTTCNRFRLHAKHTSTHSPAAPAMPRSEN